MTIINSCALPAANDRSKTSENDLQVFLKRVRWPTGFVCPRCGWKHTEAWAADKAHRVRQRHNGSKQIRTSKDFHTEGHGKATGRTVCQKCRLQTSLTSGTLLDGTRMTLAKIRDAAECFVGAPNGISAQKLGSKAGIALLSARRLIQKFHRAMKLMDEDRLGGTVQIDEGALVLVPAKRKSKPRTLIIIAVEKRSKPAGRIALKMVKYRMESSFCNLAAEMIRADATIETRRLYLYGVYMKDHGYRFRSIKRTWKEFGEDLLDPCAKVFMLVSDILKNTYRGAVKRDNLQGYLNEIAFRWNHGDNPERAALNVMARLVQPPNTTWNPILFGWTGPSDDARP